MPRPIVFDATHVIARQGVPTPTGIDRVDHAYARDLATPGGMVVGVQCLLRKPRLHAPSAVAELAQKLTRTWQDNDDVDADPVFKAVRRFALAEPEPAPAPAGLSPAPSPPIPARRETWAQRLAKRRRLVRDMLRHDARLTIPEGALFVNVTQNPTLVPRAGAFLRTRPDLKGVFLVHDLIPIDYPEFFAEGREQDFRQVLEVMFRHGHAFLVTTEAVRERLAEERRRAGFDPAPIHVAPLPLPPGFDKPVQFDRRLFDGNYVVIVGTVEPRKNHWLLLNLWREMIRAGEDPPKLVVVGALGWENESLRRMLDHTPEFAGRVLHVSNLGNAGLRSVIAHARALLMPSFVEGYGIPVIEAAALGTPVIASRGTVFADVSQGHAELVDPLDGAGWRSAVLGLASRPCAKMQGSIGPLDGFRMPLEDDYFRDVRGFLSELR